MSQGSISVVVPVYNGQNFLPAALESAFSQSRAPLEVIVVDDCSTDSSAEIARAFGARVLQSSTKLWTGGARTYGLKSALGEYYAVLDADDTWFPWHLEMAGAALDANPSVVATFSSAQQVGGNVRILYPTLPIGITDDARAIAFSSMPAVHSTMVARADAMRSVGGYPGGDLRHWADDFDLVLKLSTCGAFHCTHEVTASYRIHPDQMSKNEGSQCYDAYRSRQAFLGTVLSEHDLFVSQQKSIFRRDLINAIRWTQDGVIDALSQFGTEQQLISIPSGQALLFVAQLIRKLRLLRRSSIRLRDTLR